MAPKSSLALAYRSKSRNKGNMAAKADSSPTGMEGCPDCYDMGGMCMAHGGKVEQGDSVDAKRNHSQQDSHEVSRDTLSNKPYRAHDTDAQMYAEGGEVKDQRSLHTSGDSENPEFDEMDGAYPKQGPAEMVDYDLPNETDSSNDERDLPRLSEALSLAAEVMMDRKRRNYAMGGKVDSNSGSSSHAGALQQAIDAPDDSYLDNDSDEMDAPEEDGRWQRGLNTEPVHTMEDESHDTSDSSLVAEILRDRKKRRFGM